MAKKWFSIMATMVVLSMLLSACGESSTATVVPPTATTGTTAATATTAATNPTATTTMAGATAQPASTSSTGSAPGTTADVTLTGAGSTFVNPLMSKWSQEYTKLYPNIKINYQSIGSGGGRTQFINKTVDFGASDAPLTDAQFKDAGGDTAALHIPIAMGGVVMMYNLPEVTQQLKLSGDLIANIYLMKVTKWNNPAIAALNPGVTLPDRPIAVVHRSEGSGTTDTFTDYLSKVNTDWKNGVGRGSSVQWPGGIGAQGSEGLTNQVKLTPGSLGYVEYGYARSSGLASALVQNSSGNFVDASAANVSEAAGSLGNTSIPDDLRYSITNAPGANAYPIAATTWALVHVDEGDVNKAAALVSFLWWATHDGQSYSDPLSYAPLPRSIVERVESQLKKVNCGSEKCVK